MIEKNRILVRVEAIAIARGMRLHEETLERLAAEVLDIRDEKVEELADATKLHIGGKTKDEIEAYILEKMGEYLDFCKVNVDTDNKIEGHTWTLIDENQVHRSDERQVIGRSQHVQLGQVPAVSV